MSSLKLYAEMYIFMKCKILGLGKELKYPIIREEMSRMKNLENRVLVYYKVSLFFSCKVQQGIAFFIRETRVGKIFLKHK